MPWIIQKQSRNTRAPIFQNRHQPSICQGSRDHALRHVSDAQSGNGGVGHDFRVIQGQLSLRVDDQWLPMFFKLPSIGFTTGHADADALMAKQIIWRQWAGMPGEVVR